MYKAIVLTEDPVLFRYLKKELEGLPISLQGPLVTIKSAVETMTSGEVSLAIVDTFFPDSWGPEVAKSLRKVTDKLEIVVMGRMESRSFMDRCFRFGAVEVIPFPDPSKVARSIIAHRLRSLGQ